MERAQEELVTDYEQQSTNLRIEVCCTMINYLYSLKIHLMSVKIVTCNLLERNKS